MSINESLTIVVKAFDEIDFEPFIRAMRRLNQQLLYGGEFVIINHRGRNRLVSTRRRV